MVAGNCEICGYEAESLYVLDAHTWEVHDDAVECNFCANTFENQSEFGRERCWILHKNGSKNKFKCNSCKKSFFKQREISTP